MMPKTFIITVSGDDSANALIEEYEGKGYLVKDIKTAMSQASQYSPSLFHFKITIWFEKTQPMNYRDPV